MMDDCVLQQYEDKVRRIFHEVDPNEILEKLFENNYRTQMGTRVVRKAIPMIVENLKRNFRDVDEAKIKELYAHWKIDFHQPTPDDYKELTK